MSSSADISNDRFMHPQLTHFAINTDDVDATQAFYASVFGWKFLRETLPGVP